MKLFDEVLKSIHTVVDGIKDTVEADLVSLCSSGKIKIEKEDLPEIVRVIHMSIDNGYQKSCTISAKSIIKVIEASLVTSQPDSSFKSQSRKKV